MKKYIFIILFLVSPLVQAESRNEKIEALMEALGLIDMFTQQIEMGKQQNTQLGQKMIDQMMSQLNPSSEFQERFTKAFNKFVSKTEAPWGAEEIVDVWSSYYGPGFTDQELDQLIKFYTSPLGQKDVKVTKEAMISFSNHFQKAGQPIMEAATAEYIKDLKLIAKECDCAK